MDYDRNELGRLFAIFSQKKYDLAIACDAGHVMEYLQTFIK